MHVHRNTDQLPLFHRAVITIGTFDGVHTGHQQLIRQLKDQALRIDGETVIITFHPHPRKIVSGDQAQLRLINTLDEKIELLAWQGVDHLVVVPFTEAFSQLTAEQYVKEFLLGRFHPHTIVIGYDHQFGKGRQGNYRLLEDFSRTAGFELQEIPAHLCHSLSVSSTRIRESVSAGTISAANELLGYDFFFSGVVVEGNRLGRTIGYPTANLRIDNPEKLLPGDGVYVVEAGIGRPALWKGMMNVGVRPTVDGTRRVIEVNLFNFQGDLYDQTLRVQLKARLRGEQKFDGLDALQKQLAKDKEQAGAFFA